MIIANPIYDVVFKYLLEDIEIARELFSTILGANITNLTVKPQETLVQSDSGEIKIFHLDFKAVIDLADGQQKTVLLELQKAKKSYDLLRFRGYLGENYVKQETRINKKGDAETYSLEIVTVYILGFPLTGVDMPVLKVGRKYINVITQEEVQVTHKFITHLTHESYTIQIPHLKLNQQNALEQVLEVFSQEFVTDDLHKLDYQSTSKNPLVQKIIRRLAQAASDAEIQRLMKAEDSFDRIMNREMQEKNDKIEEQANTIEEQANTIEDLKRDVEEMKRAFEEMKKQLGL
jgi:archaellum component FlaC